MQRYIMLSDLHLCPPCVRSEDGFVVHGGAHSCGILTPRESGPEISVTNVEQIGDTLLQHLNLDSLTFLSILM